MTFWYQRFIVDKSKMHSPVESNALLHDQLRSVVHAGFFRAFQVAVYRITEKAEFNQMSSELKVGFTKSYSCQISMLTMLAQWSGVGCCEGYAYCLSTGNLSSFVMYINRQTYDLLSLVPWR